MMLFLLVRGKRWRGALIGEGKLGLEDALGEVGPGEVEDEGAGEDEEPKRRELEKVGKRRIGRESDVLH
jgi:hypothetical protein